MPVLQVTVNVPDFEEILEGDIREAVMEALVDRVLGAYIDDEPELKEGCRGDDPSHFELSRKKAEGAFIATMRKEAKEHLQTKVKAIVEARTATVVDEVLAGEFEPVDRYGDRTAKTTLRKMIGDYGTSYLTAEVDKDGRPISGYHNGPKYQRVGWLVMRTVDEVFKAELVAQVKAAADDVKKQLAGKVAGEITDTVRRLLGLPDLATG
jgi:hypothetical protein